MLYVLNPIKKEYMRFMRNILESYSNISLKQAMATELIVENDTVKGVVGLKYYAPCVILTTGTSLEGRCYVGLQYVSAGRMGERAASGLSQSLVKNGLAF